MIKNYGGYFTFPNGYLSTGKRRRKAEGLCRKQYKHMRRSIPIGIPKFILVHKNPHGASDSMGWTAEG